jgi:putative GTP pyrophosphokinase
VEYKKFAGIRCEIQITSILRHAWSEIEHEWYDLREAYPESVKRRFYRIAALLEIAESEFLDIRKSRTRYQRSVAVMVEAKVPDVPVDAVSIRSFIEQEPLVTTIDASIALALRTKVLPQTTEGYFERIARAAELAGMTKVKDIHDALEKYAAAIPQFAIRCRQDFWPQSGLQISKGISIYQLSLLLVSLRGTDAVMEFFKAFKSTPNWDLARQVAIASEAVANARAE